MRTLIYISFAAAFAAQTACATGLPTNGLQAHFRADHADMIKTSTGLPQHGSSVTNWIAEMGVATPFSLVQHESYDCPRLQTNAFELTRDTPHGMRVLQGFPRFQPFE